MTRRRLAWRGLDGWRAEPAALELDADGLVRRQPGLAAAAEA